jgi:hypothetical protein
MFADGLVAQARRWGARLTAQHRIIKPCGSGDVAERLRRRFAKSRTIVFLMFPSSLASPAILEIQII